MGREGWAYAVGSIDHIEVSCNLDKVPGIIPLHLDHLKIRNSNPSARTQQPTLDVVCNGKPAKATIVDMQWDGGGICRALCLGIPWSSHVGDTLFFLIDRYDCGTYPRGEGDWTLSSLYWVGNRARYNSERARWPFPALY